MLQFLLNLQQAHQGQYSSCILLTNNEQDHHHLILVALSTLSDTEPTEPEDEVCDAEGTSNADETMSFEQGDYILIRFQTKKHKFHCAGIMEKGIPMILGTSIT